MTPDPVEAAERPDDDWRAVLGQMQVRIWFCPDGHSSSEQRGRVEWRDGVAYCLTDGCNRTSRDSA